MPTSLPPQRAARGPMSPTTRARIAGVFYLANIATIFLSILLFRGLVVSGDVTATAANIAAHLGRYRLAFASQVVSTATSVAVAALLYGVFRPVDRSISLMATLFRVLACGLAAVGYVLQLAPLVIVNTQAPAVAPAELQALAHVFSAFQIHARNVSIAFFGCQFVVLSYLVSRATFLPRFLAPLLAIGGAGGLAFAASPAPSQLLLYFAPAGLVCELSLACWLAFKGIDVTRWNAALSALA